MEDTEVVKAVLLQSAAIKALTDVGAVKEVQELEQWVAAMCEGDIDGFFDNVSQQIAGITTPEGFLEIYKEAFFNIYKWTKEGEIVLQ